jgi:hypothetical protein
MSRRKNSTLEKEEQNATQYEEGIYKSFKYCCSKSCLKMKDDERIT